MKIGSIPAGVPTTATPNKLKRYLSELKSQLKADPAFRAWERKLNRSTEDEALLALIRAKLKQ